MKMVLKMVCLLLCMALALSLVGCSEESPYPEGYEKYKAIIGETKADALKQLKLKETELTQVFPNDDTTYHVPGTFSFCDYDFGLIMGLERACDRVSSFTYWTLVDDLSGYKAMREKLIELYGAPIQLHYTDEMFDALANRKEGTVADTWSMYRFTEEHHPEFAKYLEEVKKVYEEKFRREVNFSWNLVLQARVHEDGRFLITMIFSVGQDYTPSWQPGQDRS